MKKRIFITAIACVLFVSSSADAKKPDWLEGSSAKYPSPRYFIGVGEARLGRGAEKQVMALASDRARAEIAKTIRSEVKVESIASRTSEAKRIGRKLSNESRSTQTESVVVSAEEMLEGVKIEEFYKDKKSSTLYALAVLDRVKAAKNVEEKALIIKQELLDALSVAGDMQAGGILLQAMGKYGKAKMLSEDLEKTSELLTALNPTGKDPFGDGAVRPFEIQKIIDGLRSQMKFDVKITGPAEGVSLYVIRGLGVGAVSAGQKDLKTYTLEGATDVTSKGSMEMGEKLTVQVYQADLDMTVKDESGAVVGALTWSASANEKSDEMAKKSATRMLGRLVEKNIMEKLSGL